MKRTDIARSTDGLIDRLAESLRHHGPLAGVDADTTTGFIRRGALLALDPGEALIREDDDASGEVYLLVEGALTVKSQSGTLARLTRPGDVVGEVAVLLSSKRTADVIADGAVQVLAIPSKVLAMPEYAQVADGVSGAMIRDDWAQY